MATGSKTQAFTLALYKSAFDKEKYVFVGQKDNAQKFNMRSITGAPAIWENDATKNVIYVPSLRLTGTAQEINDFLAAHSAVISEKHGEDASDVDVSAAFGWKTVLNDDEIRNEFIEEYNRVKQAVPVTVDHARIAKYAKNIGKFTIVSAARPSRSVEELFRQVRECTAEVDSSGNKV